jgi:hypothetical protein
MKLHQIQRTVISYCELPEELSQNSSKLSEAGPDCYVEYRVTPQNEQAKYSDNFDLDNYLIKEHPELEGRTILIHVDY